MANEIRIDIKILSEDANAKLRELAKGIEEQKKAWKSFSEVMRPVGIAMTAAGAAIMGVAALSIKAAQEQAIGINVLNQALQRVGTSYDAERDAIEASISALMRKTNYSDEAQRESLMRLTTLTGDYASSLKSLPVVLDLAAALHMDLNTASLLVAKALQGNTALFTRYGVVLKEGASATEIMATLTEKFGGSAEAAANPVIQLRNQLDALMEVVGDVLIPALNTTLPIITEFARNIADWANEHPLLTKVIVGTTVALSLLMATVGPLLLMLPGLTIAFTALAGALSLAGGPVGVGLFLAGVAAITGGVLLMKKALDEMDDALTMTATTMQDTTAVTKEATSAYDAQMATIDRLAERLPWLAGQMRAKLQASMLESLNDVKALKDALKDFPVLPVADLTGHFMELNYAVEEAGKQFKQAENPLERMWSLMEQLNLLTPTSFEDFTEKAGDLADRLHTDLATAMRMLAEQAIPVLEGQIQATVRSFLDLERETKALASATEGVTDVYLTLAYRLQAMGRPMEDLLVPAEKLASIMFGATYNTEQLAQALDILARVKLDELDAELQKIVRDLLGLQQEAKLTALFGGSKLAPTGYTEALKLAESVGRPELAMKAFGVLPANAEEQESARRALERLSITQKATALAHEEELADALRAEVARIRAGGPGLQTLSPEEIAQNQEGWLNAMWNVQGAKMMDDFTKGLQAIFANTGGTYKGAPLPSFAEGGIVDRPTLAMLGEHGREAVLPLEGYSREIVNIASTMPSLPQLAEGGIVRQPTLALVGERGPEAIVPLNSRQAGQAITFNFYGPVFGDEERIAQIFRDLARRGGFAGVMD